MFTPLPNAWYDKSVWPYILLPFSLLFWLISSIRRWYICRFKQVTAELPVIVVGNISVGGTGKTPLVVYLCEQLAAAGYRPGVVSRGYGATAPSYPWPVSGDSKASEVGDEPLLIHRRTGVPVVVGPDRVAAIQSLTNNYDVDVIISDDGLQHYKMGRQIEIAVVDGQRQLGNGCLLPVGPLRELKSRLRSVNFIVQNGDGHGIETDFIMTLESADAIAIGNSDSAKVSELGPLTLTAGIGNPSRFFAAVAKLGGDVRKEVPLPDHCGLDLAMLEGLKQSETKLLMTEKDAVKLTAEPAQKEFWYLPVNGVLSSDLSQAVIKQLKS
ncbi:tetraacyldisaccharide 4'-kinase [Corallincola platygyrae]|uniref:Tetraacyldisaccharide 4'-kinase n=1 Tax=Corallincola platygyrae TaxID=1193278 RepID=A0ABW4XKX6_9GAMM